MPLDADSHIGGNSSFSTSKSDLMRFSAPSFLCRTSFSCKITGAGSPSGEKVGSSNAKKVKWSKDQLEFTYVLEFLKSKRWRVVTQTGEKLVNTYYMTDELFETRSKNLKQRKEISAYNKTVAQQQEKKDLPAGDFESLGTFGTNIFQYPEDGVNMVCGEQSTMRQEYVQYCKKFRII